MKVNIRKFSKDDIENKISWINDSKNNAFLHYELPLEYEKTLKWYERTKDSADRYDAVICVENEPVGLIGLLSIEKNVQKSEYYIVMGNHRFKGKGIALKATQLILEYAFNVLRLNKIYLFTEIDNIPAQKLFEKVGFEKEGLHVDDTLNNGKLVSRYSYAITKKIFDTKQKTTYPITIQHISESLNLNKYYMLRDDLLPFSFGGNKLRKAEYFFQDIMDNDYNYVVTYGSGSSNHVRIIANKAKQLNIPCVVISPEENYESTINSQLGEELDIQLIKCPIKDVKKTIDKEMLKLEKYGFKPYFIQGGGHGNLGTQAYVDVFNLLKKYEVKENISFDYIFFASGTGTTHAGLECGNLISGSNKKIIGISIARIKTQGQKIVEQSINDYFDKISFNTNKSLEINFIDDYILSGYASYNNEILDEIKRMFTKDGIPLDPTYTGKAFWGMKKYIKEKNIKNKNILFIHTGGTPLFFDKLEEIMKK